MSPTDFKLFSIDADGEPDFSNAGPAEPSPDRLRAALVDARTRALEKALVPSLDPLVMSAEMLERGKREGWIVQRDGAWVIDWSKA